VNKLNLTRENLTADRVRYQAEIDKLIEAGMTEDHPLVKLWARRIATVDRLLAREDVL
jgi:hypothetical protein